MNRIGIFINPTAGGGRAAGVWRALATARPELETAPVVRASDAETARAELRALVATGIERLIAVGGDGTAHLVVNVLLEEGHGERVALGLVPAGTGSDLARSLALPTSPRAALDRVLAVDPRPIDALRVDRDDGLRRYAVNTASAGLSGAVVETVNADPRRGRLSYLRSTLRGVFRFEPRPCRTLVDGEPFHDGDFYLLAMTNGRYFGRGMRVAPRAELDDGLLDVVLVPVLPRWQIPYRLPQLVTNRLFELPLVRTRKARRVRVEPPPGFPPYELDGETFPSAPAEIRVLPAALRILA